MSDVERFDREKDLLAGLRRLADDAVVPPIDPAQEQRLLAAFDAHWASGSARPHARSGRAAAVLGFLAVAATLVWAVANRDRRAGAGDPSRPPARAVAVNLAPLPSAPVAATPAPVAASTAAHRSVPPRQRPRPASRADTSFVMWPGADDLPRFESGQLMRVDLPASVAASLGLRPQRPLNDAGFVQTDVLVGQDGYARAVRLVR